MATIAVHQPSATLLPADFSPSFAEQGVAEMREEENARALLDRKICEPLKLMGYNAETISRVSRLVKKNSIVADLDIQNANAAESLIGFVKNELLNSSDMKINSNEPVCLIELEEKTSTEGARAIRDNLLDALRQHGIKPVRMYVKFLEEEATSGKVTLLNVVNTELGGPSMIQLLDASFHHKDWKQTLVVKEAWNGYDLMWRDEAWPEDVPANVPNVSEDAETTTAEQSVDLSEPTRTERVQHNVGTVSEAYKSSMDSNPATELEPADDEHSPVEVEHPAWKELREKDSTRAHVQHPTFSRDEDDHGLLDIIRTHSAGVKDREPASIISSSAKDTDDDFEVI